MRLIGRNNFCGKLYWISLMLFNCVFGLNLLFGQDPSFSSLRRILHWIPSSSFGGNQVLESGHLPWIIPHVCLLWERLNLLLYWIQTCSCAWVAHCLIGGICLHSDALFIRGPFAFFNINVKCIFVWVWTCCNSYELWMTLCWENW